MRENLILSPIQLDDGNLTNEEPVFLFQIKKWLKIEVDDDDYLLTDLITTARQQIEHYLKISLLPREISAYLQIQLPHYDPEYELPYGPVSAITAITDDTTELNDIDTDHYRIRGNGYKMISGLCTDKIHVTYTTSGYCPEVFKTAIKQQCAYLYERRGDAELPSELSPILKTMLKPFRRVV